MDILIRDLDRDTVHRLDILAAVAGMTRAEFIRHLLQREGARLALEQVAQAITAQPATD